MTKFIYVLIFVLQPLLVQADLKNCDGWQKVWDQCVVDSDCAVVTNPCGWPTASANKKYAEEAARCNTHAGAAISCASWSDMNGDKRVAKCENGLCVNREE